jgi:hypothetical protein
MKKQWGTSWGVVAASRDVAGATAAGRGVAATNYSHFFYFFIFSFFFKCFHS